VGSLGSFERDTAVRAEPPCGPERVFAAGVSPEWRAGRGPHGGYLAAMILRALTDTVADPARGPRSLTIHFARAPEPGPVAIHTTLERHGRSLSTLSARMLQDGRLMALALAAFSVPWAAPEIAELAMPEVAPADLSRDTCERLSEVAPPFTRYLVIQPRLGGMPFAGSDAAMEVGAWVRLRDAARPTDAPTVALFSDALYPASSVRLVHPAASPTIDLTIHFRTALPREHGGQPGEPCFARFRTGVVHEGFFEEDGAVWAANGVLLAQSRQLAILMPRGGAPAQPTG
jgi:acyl-CoA thioesterase